MNYVKQGLLGVGIVFASLSTMTACSVIKGTLAGTEQVVTAPVKAVDRAFTPTETKKAVHHKAHKKVYHHKKAVKKAAPEVNDNGTTDVTIGS